MDAAVFQEGENAPITAAGHSARWARWGTAQVTTSQAPASWYTGKSPNCCDSTGSLNMSYRQCPEATSSLNANRKGEAGCQNHPAQLVPSTQLVQSHQKTPEDVLPQVCLISSAFDREQELQLQLLCSSLHM